MISWARDPVSALLLPVAAFAQVLMPPGMGGLPPAMPKGAPDTSNLLNDLRSIQFGQSAQAFGGVSVGAGGTFGSMPPPSGGAFGAFRGMPSGSGGVPPASFGMPAGGAPIGSGISAPLGGGSFGRPPTAGLGTGVPTGVMMSPQQQPLGGGMGTPFGGMGSGSFGTQPSAGVGVGMPSGGMGMMGLPQQQPQQQLQQQLLQQQQQQLAMHQQMMTMMMMGGQQNQQQQLLMGIPQAGQGASLGSAPGTKGKNSGKLKVFLPDKGFGFIENDDGGQDLFFFQKELTNGDITELVAGMRLEFNVEQDNRSGKRKATSVAIHGREAPNFVGRHLGRLKSYLAEKGFGFIEAEDGSKDLFLNHSDLKSGDVADLVVGAKLEYDIERETRSGKLKATNVIVVKST
eukprot:gnl/TRDRNA2_/TRDRNA2_173727_c1_seq15.p1 gnl/TRDRNA2_/TRDRNA2_173727_c1~~gnl/TRDRNA2_/TRDRNA2_173727_c1_seq15.p1  ORF type:complete len:401 (+),score=81.50 gnl/TRDRNA2_/TRDRNA2_173727_c1_seq15:69-1271(+)